MGFPTLLSEVPHDDLDLLNEEENSENSSPDAHIYDEVGAVIRSITKIPRLSEEEENLHIWRLEAKKRRLMLLALCNPKISRSQLNIIEEVCEYYERRGKFPNGKLTKASLERDTSDHAIFLQLLTATATIHSLLLKADNQSPTNEEASKLVKYVRGLNDDELHFMMPEGHSSENLPKSYKERFHAACAMIEAGAAISTFVDISPESQSETRGLLNDLSEGAEDDPLTKAIREQQRLLDDAINDFSQHHLRLAISFSKKYRNRGVPYSDLIQEGCIAIKKAAYLFEPELGNKFSTAAVWWIRQRVDRCVDNSGRAIRIPVHVQDRLSKFRKKIAQFVTKHNRPPEFDELLDELKIERAELLDLLEYQQSIHSLDMPVGEDGDRSVGDLTAAPGTLGGIEQSTLDELMTILRLHLRPHVSLRTWLCYCMTYGLPHGENLSPPLISLLTAVSEEDALYMAEGEIPPGFEVHERKHLRKPATAEHQMLEAFRYLSDKDTCTTEGFSQLSLAQIFQLNPSRINSLLREIQTFLSGQIKQEGSVLSAQKSYPKRTRAARKALNEDRVDEEILVMKAYKRGFSLAASLQYFDVETQTGINHREKTLRKLRQKRTSLFPKKRRRSQNPITSKDLTILEKMLREKLTPEDVWSDFGVDSESGFRGRFKRTIEKYPHRLEPLVETYETSKVEDAEQSNKERIRIACQWRNREITDEQAAIALGITATRRNVSKVISDIARGNPNSGIPKRRKRDNEIIRDDHLQVAVDLQWGLISKSRAMDIMTIDDPSTFDERVKFLKKHRKEAFAGAPKIREVKLDQQKTFDPSHVLAALAYRRELLTKHDLTRAYEKHSRAATNGHLQTIYDEFQERFSVLPKRNTHNVSEPEQQHRRVLALMNGYLSPDIALKVFEVSSVEELVIEVAVIKRRDPERYAGMFFTQEEVDGYRDIWLIELSRIYLHGWKETGVTGDDLVSITGYNNEKTLVQKVIEVKTEHAELFEDAPDRRPREDQEKSVSLLHPNVAYMIRCYKDRGDKEVEDEDMMDLFDTDSKQAMVTKVAQLVNRHEELSDLRGVRRRYRTKKRRREKVSQ